MYIASFVIPNRQSFGYNPMILIKNTPLKGIHIVCV
jgi:hypothetical protein